MDVSEKERAAVFGRQGRRISDPRRLFRRGSALPARPAVVPPTDESLLGLFGLAARLASHGDLHPAGGNIEAHPGFEGFEFYLDSLFVLEKGA